MFEANNHRSISPLSLVFLVCLVVVVTIISGNRLIKKVLTISDSTMQEMKIIDTAIDDTGQVQGSSSQDTKRIYISDRTGGTNGGVISQAITDEPSIIVSSWNVSGSGEIKIFKAGEEQLVNYLIHDQEGAQLNPSINTSQLEQIGQQTITIQDYNGDPILLPMEARGIYVLEITAGEVKAYGVVVRSDIGVVIKEGKDQYIFWGQKYADKKSVDSGQLSLYSLQDRLNEVANVSFNQQGIATTDLIPEADIAIYRNAGDVALIPINLLYLNTSYSYARFPEPPLVTQIFGFTDRPLYQPTDTLKFKAFARDDEDARYTIPSGNVRVMITNDSYYGQEDVEPLYDRQLPLSSTGAVDGSFSFEDLKPGYYQVVFLMDQNVSGDEWFNYQRRGYTRFQVENYRKPEYSIAIEADDLEVIAQTDTTINVSGAYFFGQPLTDAKVSYEVYAREYYVPYYHRDVQNIDRYNAYHYGSDKVTSGTVTLDEMGLGSFPIRVTAPVGESQIYTVYAKYQSEGGEPVESATSFLVRAGNFEIYRAPGQYSYPLGENISMEVELYDHAGSPISGQTVEATIRHQEWVHVEDDRYKYGRWEEKITELGSKSATSDASGKVSIPITASQSGSYIFNIKATDSAGRAIKKEYRLWVSDSSRYNYYGDGAQALSIIASKEVYEPDETASLTISSESKDRDVLLSIERGRVQRYQVVSLDGFQRTVDIPLEATDMPNVYFKVVSFSDEDLDTGQINVEVSAARQELSISLTPDKDTYGPGDTVTLDVETTDRDGQPASAEVSVWAVDKAIFELAAETRGDIFDHFWKKRYNYTTQGHSLEGILVNAAEAGGGCFASGTMILMNDGSQKPIENVQVGDKVLTRKSDTDATLISAKVLGTTSQSNQGYLIFNETLKVTPDHKMYVNHTWKNAGSIQTGDTLTDAAGLDIMVTSIEWLPQEIEVHNLEVETYHTYFANDMYVHNEKGDPRQVFADTAYWNPSVQTGSNGKATIRFTVPDNLTTWSIAGVGATSNTLVGQTVTDIIVTKGVVVRPVVPNLLRVGDEMQFSTFVHNYTDQEQLFEVWLEYPAGEVYQEASWEPRIPARGSRNYSWRLVAGDIDPEATIEVGAVVKDNDELSDIVILPLPIEPYGVLETSSTATVGGFEIDLELPSDARNEQSSVRLNLASSLLGSLTEPARYLVGYPYGCVEQTTSRFVPTIIAKSNPALFSDALEGKDTDEMITKGITRLQGHQQTDGGWGWWYSGGSDPFISAYVVEYLKLAQDQGFDVGDQLESAQAYFTKLATQRLTGELPLEAAEDRIIKSYALSIIDPGSAESVQVTDALGNDMLALAVMANTSVGITDPSQSGLTLLESRAVRDGEGVIWEAGTSKRFGSRGASTALAMKAIIKAGGDRAIIQDAILYLSRNRLGGRYWENTFATAQILHALSLFSENSNELTPNFTYKVSLAGKTIDSGRVSGSDMWSKEVDIDIDKVPEGSNKLTVTFEGSGQLYTTYTLDAFRTDPTVLTDPASHGIAISRTYENAKGGEYSIALGEKVIVKLEVSGLNAPEDYGILVDQLPAGMVAINHNLENERNTYDSTWWRYGIRSREVTKAGMILSVSTISPGTKVYTYDARVIAPGTYAAPPARVELMYSPEIWARSGTEEMTIDSTTVFNPKPTIHSPEPTATLLSSKVSSFRAILARLPIWQQAIVMMGLTIGFIGIIIFGFKKLYFLLKEIKDRRTKIVEPAVSTEVDEPSVPEDDQPSDSQPPVTPTS